jgi:5S rRNA maturation endonuclease (ribonuclease M5)
MRIDEFVTLLEAVKPASSGYQARCPAHTDHKPSLSVSEGEDGRILVKDHAGCTTEQIVEAMNLTTTDLFPSDDALPHSAVRLVNTSAPSAPDYQPTIPWETVAALHTQLTDEQRRLLRSRRHLTDAIIDRYQLGFEERARERRLTIPIQDANGSCRDIRRWLPPEARSGDSNKMLHWRNGYGGARLFPVDQLINAAVVLCEGELDALALVSHAIPAVTTTCGATTWPSDLSAAFNGKTVTLLMDHDRAGETGAQKRAESLYAAGAKVKVATWPADRTEGWDVTDELLKHGLDSLRSIIDDASDYTPAVAPSSILRSPDAQWPQPQPLPATLPTVEPFQSKLLPEAFRDWIDDVAERMQCPPDYPAVAAMVTLAAVVGRQVGIRPQQRDDWLVVPNLWGAVIGRPGVMKTPALQEPLRPLEALEKQAKDKFVAEQQAHELDELVAEARRKKGQDDIRKALKEGSDPHKAAIEALAGNTPEPSRHRYLVNDTTVEKLGEILNANPRGLLVFRDELTGLLKSLDKEGREADKGFYLEAWNGTGRFTYDRIGRGTIDIDAACVSLLGGIQPGPFSAYIARVARGGGDDDGLMQRFQLTVWPDVSATWSNQDRAPDATARNAAWDVY